MPSQTGAPGAAPRRSVALAVTLTWVLLLAGIVEGLPRLLGRKPWRYVAEGKARSLHEVDPELGWKNRPGHSTLPPHLPGGPEIEVTILPDGSRTTGDRGGDGRPVVDLVGCSVTVGWGLSDADTFGWKLQQAHPELRVRNFGTAAYGTYQSLLRMERLIDETPKPAAVVYGFISQHEARNVATYDWLRGLKQSSERGHVASPYVTLGQDGRLVRHPPESFVVWPLAEELVSVRMANDAWMHLAAKGRDAQGDEATKRLVVEMRDLAKQKGVGFAVAFFFVLEEAKEREYRAFFDEAKVPWIDCVIPLVPENRIPGEGHPSAAVNTGWAGCIGDALPRVLGARPAD